MLYTQNLAYAYDVVLSLIRVIIKNLAYAYDVVLFNVLYFVSPFATQNF